MPSLLRDGFRCLFFLMLLVRKRKALRPYLRQRKASRISFSILIGYSILLSYLFLDKHLSDLLIGIKYGFWWIFILLSASFIGFAYKKPLQSHREKHLNIRYLSLAILVLLGWIRQLLKLLKPERFAQIGYAIHLDNYQFGEKPPIYYLTGYEGTLRRQGLFSGPNNYGYFLVAFLPFILTFPFSSTHHQGNNKGKRGILLIWIAAILFTLSRAAIIGSVIVLICSYAPRLQTASCHNKKKLIW